LQTEKEIAPWKKSTPISTVDLNSYLAIKFVIKISGLTHSRLSNRN